MANSNANVNIKVGFSVDKSGLNEMQSLFQQIAYSAKEPGNELKVGLQEAGKVAQTLDGILDKTFNTSLGTLNVTKFNQELKKSGLTLQEVQSKLTAIGGQGATAYNRLAQAILGTNLQLKQSSKLLDDMAKSMSNTIKWGITSSIFNNITNSIQKAVDYSRKLDTSLNDIRIVTEKSAESMEKFADKANKGAIALGASTLDYTNASLIYYQQGLEDAEVQARTETTLKAANVTGQRGEEVSEQLTAVWNGYKVTAEETELYVDKLAAVAATTASDLEELSTGMSKVASAANSMGVDVDQLNAQLATIISVTRQAPENVGTALKTIYARLGDLKADGTDEFGISLGEVSSQLETMGIQILDQEGNLRDMGSVMEEVAGKWNQWTEAQRQAAAIAMAGKRQYNNLIALFENWDMYTSSLETSANAMGTLQKQQDIYMESTAAHLQQLRTAWQGLYDDMIETDEMNDLYDLITDLVQVLDNFVASFGGGLKTIVGFGAIVANIFNKQIADGINNAIARQEIYKQNLQALQARDIIQQNGVSNPTGVEVVDQAVAANTEKQLEYNKRLYDIRQGITTEQYNEGIELQKNIGLLEQQKVLLADQLTVEDKKILGQERINEMMQAEYSAAERMSDETAQRVNEEDELLTKYSQKRDLIKEEFQNIKNIITTNKEESAIMQEINRHLTSIRNLSKNYGEDINKQIRALINEAVVHKNSKETLVNIKKIREQIIALVDKEVTKAENSYDQDIQRLEVEQKILEIKKQVAAIQAKQNDFIQQFEALEEVGQKAKSVTQSIMGITSVVGSMAMAFSSISSLVDTLNSDADAVDKFLQILMAGSMILPIFINSLNKMNEAMGFEVGIIELLNKKQAAKIAQTQAEVLADEARVAMSKISNAESEKDLILKQESIGALAEKIIAENLYTTATEASTIAQELSNDEEFKALGLTESETTALIAEIVALKAKKTADDAATISQNALNASMLANPLTWIVVVLAAATAGIVLYTKAIEANLQKEIELNKKNIERINTIQQEVDANQELYNSYEKTLKAYQEGNKSKEDMQKVTEELCKKYDIEINKLDILADRYDKYTERIRNARKAELDNIISETEDERISAGTVLKDTVKKYKKDRVSLNYNLSNDNFGSEQKYVDLFSQAGLGSVYADANGDPTGFVFNIDTTDAEKAVEDIATLEELLKRIRKENPENYADSSMYKTAEAYYEELSESYNEYLEVSKQLPNYQLERNILDIDTNDIKNVEDYTKKIEELYKPFENNKNISKQDIRDKLILSNEDLDYLDTQYEVVQTLKENIGEAEEEIYNYIENLPPSDKTILFSGQIDIDGLKTKEQVTEAINNVKNSINPEDLNIAASLRDKVSSDKKLTKTQIKEAAGEESKLSQDYETELSDFDNASQLKQVDILNQIVDDKIAANQRYLKNAKETAEKEKELEEKRLETYKKELEEGQKRLNYLNGLQRKRDLTEEEKEEYDKLKVNLDETGEKAEETKIKIESLQDIAEHGLSSEEIDNMVYDNMIAGIDGVITEAEVLRNLTDDIGEGWTIAADKIENFGKNFPEILENAENYQFLQDGSLQLTEAGQKALKDTLEIRKTNLKAVNEEYQLELQKQADIQQAAADYYNQQADMLEAYLNGEADAKETEQKMEASLNDYKKQLMEITGQNDQELNKTIQENLGLTRVNAQDNLDDIYKYWCSVGEAAAAASVAYETGEFNPPGYSGDSGSREVKVNTRSFEGKDSSEAVNSLEKMSSEQIQSLIDDFRAKADEASNKAADYISKKVGAGAAIKAFENSADNAISGKGNGKEKKTKEQKDKDEKRLDDEFDRYWEIKKAIDAVDTALNKLSKDQENLYGDELADSLMKTNELLEQQAANYARLAEEQKKEAAELQGVLGGMGVTFDASGAITNYAAATTAALAQYNEAIAKYNAGLIDEASFKIYETQYELFKKQLERYDQLFYTEMKETQEKLEEIERQKKANNLKAWQVKLEVKLEMKELKREWNDFLNEINSDFKSVYKDLRVEVENMKKNAKTYGGKDGTIMTEINAIKHVEKEIDKMKGGGVSKEYESISQAQEELKKLNEKLITDAKAFHDLVVQAWQAYLEGIDQVKDQLDYIVDRYERINDNLAYQKQLVELLYGPEAFKMMDSYYKAAIHNSLGQIDAVKQQRDMWKEQFEEALKRNNASMNDMSTWTEDMKKAYDNWQEAQSSLNDLVVAHIQLLKDEYANTVKKTIKELEKALTGSTLKDVQEDWERATAAADKYKDEVEKVYELQTYANKIDKAINETDNIKAQQKLAKLRDQEIKDLQEKKKLTQYDLDAANARLEIAMKEIALEEAQENKSSMKVVRNEEGNWSYQYVADQEDIEQKQQDLLDSYNELYELAKSAYEENLNSAMELQEVYLQKMEEIALDETLTEEQKQQKLGELRTWYEEQYTALAEENELYRQDMMEAGTMLQLTAYEQDHEVYGELTKEKKDMFEDMITNGWSNNLEDFHIAWKTNSEDMTSEMKTALDNIKKNFNDTMSETLPIWTSAAQDIIELWNKDGGSSVKTAITKAYESIKDANDKYITSIKDLEKTAGVSFSNLEKQIEKNIDATNDLDGAMEDACNNGEQYIEQLRKAAEELEEAWNQVKDAIEDAIRELEEYLRIRGQAGSSGTDGLAPSAGGGASSSSSSGGKDDGSGSGSSGDGTSGLYKIVGGGRTLGSGYRSESAAQTAKKAGIKKWEPKYDDKGFKINQSPEQAAEYRAWLNSIIEKYRTGGYTGSWSGADIEENGRLAMLHQKELVLNADDTKNMLDAIGIVRALSSFISATTAGLAAAPAPSVSSNIANSSNSYGDVIIQADFPNANDVTEIREAILSLPNLAAQYFAQNRR